MPSSRAPRAHSSNGRKVRRGNTSEIRPMRPVAQVPRPHNYAAPRPTSRGRTGRHAPSHASYQPRRGHGAVRVILVLLLIAGIGVAGFFAFQKLTHPYEGAQVEDGQDVTVVIPEGSSGTQIIQELLDKGVIHSSKDFLKVVEERGAGQSLRSGTYSFVTGSDPEVIVAQLVEGPNSTEGQLQLPEGLTVTQTAELVESALGIPTKEFLEQAKASNYEDDYSFLEDAGRDSLEGFLYPKTYDFAGKDVTADSVIRTMLSQFETEVHGLDLVAARKKLSDRYNLNVSDYNVLTIASIVEKEALSDDDCAKVASVFYNRLSIGQSLESDATKAYDTGGVVTSDNLLEDSAYNTYTRSGLPPTPICSPSLRAIQAALDPMDTDYYYFFILQNDVYSNHTFSQTYEEHQSKYEEALVEQAEAMEKASSGKSSATTTADGEE